MKNNQVKTAARVKKDKIHEALALLNEAAKDKKNELYEIIADKYSDVKDLLSEKADEGIQAAERTRRQILRAFKHQEENLVKNAHEIDKKIHKNPWVFLGSVALVSFVFGRFFFRGK